MTTFNNYCCEINMFRIQIMLHNEMLTKVQLFIVI